MKRKFYMLFSALLIFSLYACGSSNVATKGEGICGYAFDRLAFVSPVRYRP